MSSNKSLSSDSFLKIENWLATSWNLTAPNDGPCEDLFPASCSLYFLSTLCNTSRGHWLFIRPHLYVTHSFCLFLVVFLKLWLVTWSGRAVTRNTAMKNKGLFVPFSRRCRSVACVTNEGRLRTSTRTHGHRNPRPHTEIETSNSLWPQLSSNITSN